MRIKGIDYPEELLKAQADGDLVIFAGAGVSCPSPSSLPTFGRLVEEIGRASNIPRAPNEPEDRYLGRLRKSGINVHGEAAGILLNRTSQPNAFHTALPSVFGDAKKIRLVTTNFDAHFSTAITSLYGGAADTFYAPALPLGDDFLGIVYLHGSAARKPEGCVLTDEDFGRAYLTQGWATRFLAAMFARYVVLFIGYSHNDPVMHYLARGLPPASSRRRFAFTPNSESELRDWGLRGVIPLPYNAGEDHGPLTASVDEWKRESTCGLLEKVQRVRSIAEGGLPLSAEDGDYLTHSLRTPSTARVFFEHARSPDWLPWLRENAGADALLRPGELTTDLDRALAHWAVDKFFDQDGPALFAFLHSGQNREAAINPRVAWHLVARLIRGSSNVKGITFSRWVGTLLSQPMHLLTYDDQAKLLCGCRFPEDRAISLMLFDLLTTPKLEWPGQASFAQLFFEDYHEINLEGDRNHWLSKAWEELFIPNLSGYVSDLIPILTKNLTSAHGLLQVAGRGTGDWDPFSLSRQTVADETEDGIPKTIGLLIEAAKTCLDLLLTTSAVETSALICQWLRPGTPSLQRLGIYGQGARKDLNDDAKLSWLISSGLLWKFRGDTFWLLERIYSKANTASRELMLSHVAAGPDSSAEKDHASEVYNVLVWLAKVAPACPMTTTALELFQASHPALKPSPHPNLVFWSGGEWIEDKTQGFELDTIGAKPPLLFLEQLKTWVPSSRNSDPAAAVAAVVAGKPCWGVEWIKALEQSQTPDPTLWRAACAGWSGATIPLETWKTILELTETVAAPSDYFEGFAGVLDDATRKGDGGFLPLLLDSAICVAKRVWTEALSKSAPAERLHGDWLTAAVNSAGGKLAAFWLQALAAKRTALGGAWEGIPSELREHLVQILKSEAGAAVHASVVFASKLHYLYGIDAAFCRETLLPLFDWVQNEARAEQSWHGFLFWGRWHRDFMDRLLPSFEGMLSRLNELPTELQEAAIGQFSGIALLGFKDALEGRWLYSALARLSPSDCERFARHFGRRLREAKQEMVYAVWDGWLRTYFTSRARGTPRQPSPKEFGIMLQWLLALGDRFPEGVDILREVTTPASVDYMGLLERLEESSLPTTHPTPLSQFLAFVLRQTVENFYTGSRAIVLWQVLKDGGVDHSLLKQLREAFLELGQDPEEQILG